MSRERILVFMGQFYFPYHDRGNPAKVDPENRNLITSVFPGMLVSAGRGAVAARKPCELVRAFLG